MPGGLEPHRFGLWSQMTFRHYQAIFYMSLVDHYSCSPNLRKILKPPKPLHPPHSSQQKTLPPTSLQKLRTWRGGNVFHLQGPCPPAAHAIFMLSQEESPFPIKANSSSEFDSCLHRNTTHWLSSFSWTCPLGHSPPASNILKQNKMNKENLLPSYARSSSFHPPSFISLNSQVSLKIFFEILYF